VRWGRSRLRDAAAMILATGWAWVATPVVAE
jgi:hypothetical protein